MKKKINQTLIIAYVAISLLAIIYLFYLVLDYSNTKPFSLTGRLVQPSSNFTLQTAVKDLSQKQYKVYVKDLPYKIDPVYKNSVDDSISYWEEKENVDFVYTDEEKEADLIIYWAKDYSVGHVGFAYENLIEIGLGDSYCYNEWRPYTYDYVTHNMKHEFGHFLGYDHSEDLNDIMYFMSRQEYDFTINESDVLPQGYYQYYGFCSLSQTPSFDIEIKSDKKIDVVTVPNYIEYEKMLDAKSFDSYKSCSKSNVDDFTMICSLTNDSGIVIINNQDDATLYDIKVSEIY